MSVPVDNPLVLDAVTALDRDEARSVTTSGAGHQFEIQLGHLCNNRCVFCSSGQLTQLKVARAIPLAPIVAAIEEAHARGARRVTFLGGEPTLHRGFLAAVRRAVELGFSEIVIFTNGVLLPHPGFIDSVCALGRFEWRISIQGGDEAAHVAVTGRKDSFRRIVDGLRLLAARGQRVTANVCVNEHSHRSLPGYVDLVREHGIQQLHADIVRPSSIGQYSDEYLASIQPRYSAMAPSFRAMLERFDAELPDFDVNVGNLPFCVLPEWSDRIHHGGEPTVTRSCDAVGLEPGVDKYDWHRSLRRHPERCAPCVFRPHCTGVFTEYLRIHGDDEFQPVTRDRLAALDPSQRAFTLLVAPDLAPLRAGTPPHGFALRDWSERARERRVDVRYDLPRGTTLALAFVPPLAVDVPLDGAPVALVTPLDRAPAALVPLDGAPAALVTPLDRAPAALDVPLDGAPAALVTTLDRAPAALDVPLDGAPAALVTTRYRMTVSLAGLATAAELRALLEFIAGTLAAAVEVTVVQPLDVAAVSEALAAPARLALARARVSRLAYAVFRRRRFGSWRCVGWRPIDDGTAGALVELQGPPARSLDLCLRCDPAPGGTVSLDHRAGTGVTTEDARPLLDEVRALLATLSAG